MLSTGELLSPHPNISPPYVVKDGRGKLSGFDVEVLGEIGRRLGVQVKYVTDGNGSIYSSAGQWNGNYDIVVNSMTPTAERAKHVTFAATYYSALGVLLVHSKNRTIRTLADASERRIGAVKGTNDELYLSHRPFGIIDEAPVNYKIANPTILTYDNEEQAFEALAGRGLDGVVTYLPAAVAQIKGGKPFRLVDQPLYRIPQAIAIKPGDPEFADLLGQIVDGMQVDGTLRNLSMKWFEFDLTGNALPGGRASN